jgi:hypothetical protein
MVCAHPKSGDMLEERAHGATNVGLAQKYFANKTQKTVCNSLYVHWEKHVNLADSIALLPSVLSQSQGVPVAVSTERVFNRLAKERMNAQFNIEKLLVTLMERFNLLEDDFLTNHMNAKCDVCGRGPYQDANLSKVLSVADRILAANTEWQKIKNPKMVIKHFFDSTFLKFVQTMMNIYTTNLREKGVLARQAAIEFSEGKISHQLLLRRITEIEDMGANAIAERGIVELRTIQEHIDKEFGKSGWGGPT